ncbi:MAG TPA: O-antigen ligase family protein [Gaiellaceae bacterium]|nr:O-antigen ligase family protein [Gaiellaceae bacterium]
MPRSDLLGRSRPVVWDSAALVPALTAAVPAVLAFVTATAVSAANGGYFPTEWGWSAIALLLVAGTAVVVRTRLPLGRLEWTMLGALAAFTGWVALSITWSTSSAQPVLETERDVVYVAAVAALVVVASRRSLPWIAGAVLAATYSVSAFALATRLAPNAVGSYDSSAVYQLATPFGYWNALGLFVAIGLLLGVGFAAHGRSTLLRAAAAAALVPLACTLYFTFSRGAWLAVAAGAVVALALDPARLRTVAILLALLPAPALAVFAASRSHALTHAGAPLAAAARDGHRVAVVLVVLSVLEALVALALCGPGRRLVENRRAGIAAAATLVVVVGVGAGAALVRAGGPAKLVGNAYDAFTSPERPNGSDLNRRLVNLSGSGRTDYWRVAWHDFVDHPLLGSGAGSYERFWIRDRPNAFYARDAHNLYLEVLAELGPVGLALLAIGLGTPLVAAVRLRRRPLAAAVVGAYVAYLLHAAIDWDWEMAGLTITALLCSGALVVAARPEQSGRTLTAPLRVASLALVVPLVAFAFVLQVGNSTLEAAARAADRGETARAEAQARRAKTWLPWSFQPWQILGEAQLAHGDLVAARRSFRVAIAKDSQNWGLWLEFAEASKGATRRRALDRASRLAPRSAEVADLRRRP